jgi:hypothetical protein
VDRARVERETAVRYLLLATMSLAGIATYADLAEARGRGTGAGQSQFRAEPKQARIMRPAEFVIVRTPRPPSRR